jgi:hypothetical protein
MFPADGGVIAVENMRKRVDRFHACYQADDVTNFRGTKWGLLLAISDYATHVPLTHENSVKGISPRPC